MYCQMQVGGMTRFGPTLKARDCTWNMRNSNFHHYRIDYV